MRSFPVAAAVLVTLGAGACRELGLEDRGGTPRERYERSLEKADLLSTALGRRWLDAGAAAVAAAPRHATPLAESGYLAPERPAAVGYRIAVRRGQRLVAAATHTGAEAGPLFIDVFTASDPTRPPAHLLSADSGTSRIETEIRRDADVIVRLQPALLRGGRYEVRIHLEPVLGFPVAGQAAAAIRSRFGAERDAGRRSHEGVDIFAPRGTPVVAAAAGVATRVGANRLGGNVVFVADRVREEAHYYAHLDTQAVAEGQRVEAGDTLGFVGNTGNARTTPPHLHFGIYSRGRGAVDPFPYLAAPDTVAPLPRVPEEPFGGFRRTVRAGATLVVAPGADSSVRIPGRALLRIVGAAGDWYRIERAGGGSGYVRATATEPIAERLATVPAGTLIRERADSSAVVVASVGPAGGEVVARDDGFDFVRSGDVAGWVVREAR